MLEDAGEPPHVEIVDLDARIREMLQVTTRQGGGRPETSIVQVNGRAIPVQLNLALGLLHPRRETEVLTMWVDFLCINQDDLQERSREVYRMANIYRDARDIAVWL